METKISDIKDKKLKAENITLAAIYNILFTNDIVCSCLLYTSTKLPQNMSKEEEIAYILKKADENCDHIEIRKILNESNT